MQTTQIIDLDLLQCDHCGFVVKDAPRESRYGTCPACHYSAGWTFVGTRHYAYICPACGAEMREGTEDEMIARSDDYWTVDFLRICPNCGHDESDGYD